MAPVYNSMLNRCRPAHHRTLSAVLIKPDSARFWCAVALELLANHVVVISRLEGWSHLELLDQPQLQLIWRYWTTILNIHRTFLGLLLPCEKKQTLNDSGSSVLFVPNLQGKWSIKPPHCQSCFNSVSYRIKVALILLLLKYFTSLTVLVVCTTYNQS